MKKIIAVPTENGKLSAHFGHCETFTLIETEDNVIVNETTVDPPAHQPGVYPRFLAEQGVNVIIAGGMGMHAQQLFAENEIEVCIGVQSESPRLLVTDYLNQQLSTGQNLCDH